MAEAIVIVGAGECGARAAVALREAGFAGTVTLIGGEALAPYERPPLSKAVLTDEVVPAPKTIRDEAQLAAAGIEFMPGVAAAGIDRPGHRVLLADGRSLPYDRLLIATGATARRLPVEGGEHALLLRSFGDALALRERLAPGRRVGIVGGGFIGLEVAASAASRGATVTVIELADRLMARIVPAEIAAVIAARHDLAGVKVITGSGVTRIERNGDAFRIVPSDSDPVDCDTVVAGVGAAPALELARDAGLKIDNGIRCDERLATSDPDIFAAGDCCSFPHPLFGGRRMRLEAWRSAQDQGTHVARNLAGAAEPYAAVPWFWSDQYDLGLQIAGLPDAASIRVARKRVDGVGIHFELDSNGRLTAAYAVGAGTAVAKDIRLAEMLIGRRAVPDRAALADPAVNLKALLRSAEAA